MHEINIPEVVEEIKAVFQRYEKALMDNDVEVLNGFFLESTETLRYGIAENLYGIDQIRSFRGATARPPQRRLENTRITTFGRGFAVANTEFHRENWMRCGRQSQAWVRMPEGWRIVSAHVSIIDLPKPA